VKPRQPFHSDSRPENSGIPFFTVWAPVAILACLLGPTRSVMAMTAGTQGPSDSLVLYKGTGEYKGDLWYPESYSADQIKKGSSAIPAGKAKALMRNRIDAWWPVLTKYLPFSRPELAYAFFLGEATLESTLNPGVETAIADWGQNPAHAYGLLQTAETGYSSQFPGWMKEDVPGFAQAPLTPRNFYDPVVSVDMGLRKACWFSLKAREDLIAKKGFAKDAPLSAFATSRDFWMLILKGFNTGWATLDVQESGSWTVNKAWYEFYGTWSPAMSAWYLAENHLYDDVKSYHTDSRVNAYLKTPYDWLIKAPTAIGPAAKRATRTRSTAAVTPGSILAEGHPYTLTGRSFARPDPPPRLP
jgi:hypothetical protein